MTFSQSFLKTKTLKERQLKNGKEKEESAKAEQKPPAVKPILGAYRGKIVQSKINSFRKPSESTDNKSAVPERKPITQTAPIRPTISAARKPLVRPSSVSDVKLKKSQVPPKKPTVTSQVKTSTRVTIKSKAKPETTRRVTHFVPTVTSQAKASKTTVTKSRVQHVTVRRTTHVFNHKKSLGANVQQGLDVQKTEPKKGSDVAGMQKTKRVTVGPVGSLPSRQQPSVIGRYPRANESAEERKYVFFLPCTLNFMVSSPINKRVT